MCLESWCKTNRKKMIILSKDNDFHKYKSRHLIFIDDISSILQELTIYFDSFQSTQVLPAIKQILSHYRSELLGIISKDITETVIIRTDYERTSNFKIEKIDIIEDRITSIRDNYADVQLIIQVIASMTVHPSPKDIDRAIFEDNISKHKITKSILIPVDIEIHFKNEKIAKIKWINSNDPVTIEFE